MAMESKRFVTRPVSPLWQDLDVGLEETDEEAREFNRLVTEEIKWKTIVEDNTSGQPLQHGVPQAPRELNHAAELSARVIEPPPEPADTGHIASEPVYPRSMQGSNFMASKISSRNFDKSISTPNLSRLTGRSTLPSVPTPKDVSTPLPAPLSRASTSRLRQVIVQTPDNIASPIDTPTATKDLGQQDNASPSKTSNNADVTPKPIGSGVFASLKGKKDYQTLTKHFEDFTKHVAKRESVVGKSNAKTRVGRSATLTAGLGGRVFSGLRFCMPPELGQVSKHKHRWDIIAKLGGQVTLQPDTATTHVIWDGKSESSLLKELGLSSFGDLPNGTLCVKWSYVSECKMTGTLLDPSTYLTFRNPFGRQTSGTSATSIKLGAKALAIAPRGSATGITAPFKASTRLTDITRDLKTGAIGNEKTAGSSIAISRKRQHTASDSDTESPRAPVRIPVARSSAALGPSRSAVPARFQNSKERTENPPTIATEHRLPTGPGWEIPPEDGRDGLDDFISGVKNGTISEEIADGADDAADDETHSKSSGLSDDEAPENPDSKADKYRCGQKNDGTKTKGPNEHLARKFEELHDLYLGVQGKSPFAIRQYEQASSICRRTMWPITSGKEALKIKGIGKSIADRIDEFLSGAQGRQFYEENDQAKIISVFKDIYGVGRTFANELYRRGARSIEDLKTHDYGLTAGQRIGVELYEDLKTRIPREECRQLYEIIRAEAMVIDPKVWIEIMGSYRRGQEDSGDVDILITRDTADGFNHSGVLKRLIDRLQNRGIITHDLSTPHDWRALEAKWMGVGRLDSNSRYRRIDILCIPFEQWGAALIYFTGNEIFNRSLRLYARKKGYSLNQRGLSTGVIRDKQGLKMTEGEIIASRTEKEIFDVLGLRWRAPHHRRP